MNSSFKDTAKLSLQIVASVFAGHYAGKLVAYVFDRLISTSTK